MRLKTSCAVKRVGLGGLRVFASLCLIRMGAASPGCWGFGGESVGKLLLAKYALHGDFSPASYIRRAMGNYIRAFCVSEDVPPITKVVQWLATREVVVKVENGDPLKMQSRGWDQVSLIYKEGKLPIIARCTRTDVKGNGSASDEIKMFLEKIGAVGKNKTKKRIADHLKATRFI